ncbi:MAG: type II toxin-antitoxin system Phd/YefM family antitoxin [Synergistaceae bacterium]|nr:type II toxin-antitoxin system Phd/YefM family antitoxin [Synergistaceae bacterium]
MRILNANKARGQFFELLSEVNDNSSPVMILNDNGKNAVLISEDDWDSLQETLYLHSIPGMVESINQARQESLDECKEYDPNEEWSNLYSENTLKAITAKSRSKTLSAAIVGRSKNIHVKFFHTKGVIHD